MPTAAPALTSCLRTEGETILKTLSSLSSALRFLADVGAGLSPLLTAPHPSPHSLPLPCCQIHVPSEPP